MTDEIKGLVAELTDDANELDVQAQHLVVTREFVARIRQAASLLTLSDEARVRAEASADFWLGTAKDHEADAQASEALVRELVEGLRRLGSMEPFAVANGIWPGPDHEISARIEYAQALILRAGNLGSSVVESAALLAPQANCSAAQSLDGKGEL